MSDSGTQGGATSSDGGLGNEGTIPDNPTGVGIGAGEQSTFEPEEDPEAAAGEPGGTDDDSSLEGSGHA